MAKIGLIDVDGHNFPNLALMRISAYHKAKGDQVEWWWSDFIIADAAARYFKAHGITKLPARKALQAEIEQVYSTKDTPLHLRAVTSCQFMVSGSISLPLPGFFSPFPHGTCPLSVAI